MYYLALIWDPEDDERAQNARWLLRGFQSNGAGWRTALDLPGMAVCYRRRSGSDIDEVYALADGRGVVLGKLFERSYTQYDDTHEAGPRPVVLDEQQSAKAVASAGDYLLENYWGRYVALLRDPVAQTCWVLRDPSGGVPCQRTSLFGTEVYFVRLEDCERLGEFQFTIDRRFLLGHLIYATSCMRRTALNEIETVLPGERIVHRGARCESTFAWNPIVIAGGDRIENEDEACHLIRRIVRACTHAWASCYDGILHSLSGGLDSSILLTALADAPTRPRILCRNFFLPGPNSDEREFARRMASRMRFELIEEMARTDYSTQALHRSVRSLFPVAWPADVDDDQRESHFLRSHRIEAEFAGHGGDEVFFRIGSFPTAVDYAWLHGARRALLPIALDDAVLRESSIWNVLRLVYRYGLHKRRWHMRDSVPFGAMPLMAASLRRDARRDPELWHPLYRDAPRLPPGKLEQAYLFSYGTAKHYDALRAANPAEYVSPLMSQPMLELSLRIPLYVLATGGQDRSLARRAFAADLPEEVILRKSKAAGTHQFRVLTSRNLGAIRDLLLDGYLVREGFLDRTSLEQALSGEASRQQSETLEICDYVSVELWARAWCEREVTRDAADHGGVTGLAAGT